MDKLYAIYKTNELKDELAIRKGYISKTGAKSALTNLAKKDAGLEKIKAMNQLTEVKKEQIYKEKEKYEIKKFIPEKELTFSNWIKNKLGWL